MHWPCPLFRSCLHPYTTQAALNEEVDKRTSWFYTIKWQVPSAKESSVLCYEDATVSLCHPNISVVSTDQDLSQIIQRKSKEWENIKQNKASSHHVQNQRGTPKHHPGIWIDACASRWSKHNSIYLIVPLVSLASSAPLRDYRPFLIWKTKIKYTKTVSVVMPACSHASFGH